MPSNQQSTTICMSFYERNNNETIPGAFVGGCPVIKLSYRQGSERKQKEMTYI